MAKMENSYLYETLKSVYKEISLEEISNNNKFDDCTHTAHVMFYSPQDPPIRQTMKHCVLMQMRFDGRLGFPGGVAGPGETPEDAATRETQEEMGVIQNQFQVTRKDWIVTHYLEETKFILHFFAKHISEEDMVTILSSAIKHMKGEPELMGVMRVPLYTKRDGIRGFPAFLKNEFAGCAKEQLLCAIVKTGIMTKMDVVKALLAEPNLL